MSHRLVRNVMLMAGLSLTAVAVAEEVTVVTYMPAPTGRFDQAETTGTAALATKGGGVGIGTSKPGSNKLLDIATDVQSPSGGACSPGYTFYDENSNGTPDSNECKQTILTVDERGNLDLRRVRIIRNGNAPIRLRAFSDVGRGVIHFDRARGDRSAPAPVQLGDKLGIIRFRGFNPPPYAELPDEDENPDEGDFTYGQSVVIKAVVDGPVLADDVPGRLTFHTHEAGTGPGGLTERMRISHKGNIGIGTSGDPKGLLHLERERNTTLRLRSYSNAGKGTIIFDRARNTRDDPQPVTAGTKLGVISFRGFNPDATDPDPDDPLDLDDPIVGDFKYGISASIKAVVDDPVGVDDVPGRLTFHTHEAGTGPGGLTERMRIDSVGQVGIGTSMPVSRLQVAAPYPKAGTPIPGGVAVGLPDWVTMSVLTSDPQAADKGAFLGLGGPYDNAGATNVLYGVIAGRKENGISADGHGYLGLYTGPLGGGPLGNPGLPERMRIDSQGRIALGGGSPSTIAGLGAPGLGGPVQQGIALTDGAMFVPVFSGVEISDLRLYIEDNIDDRFSIWGYSCGGTCGDLSGSSNIATFVASGKVGIGTTEPDARLHVAGNIGASPSMIIDGDLSIPTGTINCPNCGPPLSDARLKANLMPVTDVLGKLDAVHVVSYEWNGAAIALGLPSGQREIGVTAQDVEVVFPEFVKTAGEHGYKGVDYQRFSAVLIQAVKELRAENQALQERIERLEQHLQANAPE